MRITEVRLMTGSLAVHHIEQDGMKRPHAGFAQGLEKSKGSAQRFLRRALVADFSGNSMPEKNRPGQIPVAAAK